MSHGMHTCFKAIYYSLTLQERVIQTSLERATYSHLHMKKSETTFSSPVWQWDNVNWTIQWDSKYSSTYHLESVLSSSGDCGSRVSMFENISDPPDDSTPLFPTTTDILKRFLFVRYLHTTPFPFARWDFTLGETCVKLFTQLTFLHRDLLPNEHICLKTNGRGWGNCLCINARERRGGGMSTNMQRQPSTQNSCQQ